MMRSGRGSQPTVVPVWGGIAGLAAGPAMGRYSRSESVLPASAHAIFHSAAIPTTRDTGAIRAVATAASGVAS